VPCIWANSNQVIGTTGLAALGILTVGAIAQSIVEVSNMEVLIELLEAVPVDVVLCCLLLSSDCLLGTCLEE